MSERDGYAHGTPCWVDHSSADPAAAASFYGELLGWETEDVMPPGSGGQYFMARLRGRDVAALSGQQEEGPPYWTTYIAVDDADATAAKVPDAGGRVLAGPFDVFDAGRMAVLADQAGTPFSIWQAGRTRGAGIVNEPGTLSWNELTTRDPEGSKAFYGAVFGWQALPVDAGGVEYSVWRLAGVDYEGRDGIGGMMPMVGDQWPADLPNHWMVYFAVQDTDAAVARLEGLGGRLTVPTFDTAAGRVAVVTDPLGAAFSVITLSAQAAASAP